MLADAAWMWGGWRLESSGLMVGGYMGAAPLAHALMGNTRSALISGGLRSGAVALIAATAVHAIESDCGDCEVELGVLYVGVIGIAAVMVADWLVLAKKEVPVAGSVQPNRAPDWVVTPQVQARDGGLQLGVGGWF
jgi:hypothetical protein